MKILLLAIITICSSANAISQQFRWEGLTLSNVKGSFYVMKDNQRFLFVSSYAKDSIRPNTIYQEDLVTYLERKEIISISKAMAIARELEFKVQSTRLNYSDTSENNIQWHLIGPEKYKRNFIRMRRSKTTWKVLIINAKTGEFIEIKRRKIISKMRML